MATPQFIPTAVQTFPNAGIIPVRDPDKARRRSVKLPVSITYAKGTILGELTGNNEQQTLTGSGTISGGTFDLTFGGQTASAIPFNVNAATLQTTLEGLSTIGAGNIAVTGGPITGAGVFTFTFQNDLGNTNVAQMTVNPAALTGGGTAAMATTVAGSAGTPGTYKKVVLTATDGSQRPRALLEVDCKTDGSGNIAFSTTDLAGPHGETFDSAPAFFSGNFDLADLPDITQGIIDAWPGSKIIMGSIANGGEFSIGG